VLAAALLLTAYGAAAAELVALDTRSGVEQRLILLRPDGPPAASVILFAGGKGALNLSSFLGAPSIAWGKNNFLVRTRDQFAEQGFLVAVVDAPSDRQSKKGMLGGFRTSAEHVQDIDAVIAYLREQADVPVWLVGTSRGTESAAHLAIRSTENPAGLVLTSSMSERNAKGTALPDMALSQVTIPTLLVAHERDACPKTPPAGAGTIAGLLTAAPAVEVKRFSGGDTPRSKPCQAMSYHGFLGIEDEVVAAIAAFIKAQ
jgi:pimeloyl-ACP methyl ester carboxylesterase